MDFVCVGKIIKPQGIKGEVKILPLIDIPAIFNGKHPLFIERKPTKIKTATFRLGYGYVLFDEIRDRNVAENYRKKIDERVRNILGATQIDEARLLQEVAIFADKSNVDEEITRLKSHISQFRKILLAENAGRKLDFLVQEFNREANTICSKANDVVLTGKGLELKCEIEKIREQVQNIE